ncbi:MAG: cation transporter [Chromatiales bacterium]|nr:cation transporter [Chromatiales bacterium]
MTITTLILPAPAAGNLLLLATALTLGFAGVEAAVGLWAGSLALVADAGHMVNDAAALALGGGRGLVGKTRGLGAAQLWAWDAPSSSPH